MDHRRNYELKNYTQNRNIDQQNRIDSPEDLHSSIKSLSHIQLFVTPMDHSMPGFPVHHQLPELAQIHVHQVRDAIQPSHPLSYPSLPAFNLSEHQGLFQ